MKMNFIGPIFPTDPCAVRAFVEIMNIILMSANIMEVNKRLIERNVHPHYRSLSGYFRWSFDNDRFTLWQRTEYNSTVCFGCRILEIHFSVLVCEDRVKANAISN